MRADSAVEPTKSENITVTWRRSARSSGGALGPLGVVVGALGDPAALVSPRSAAMASNSFTRCPIEATPSSFSVVRQARKNRHVYLVLAECRLVLAEAQAPQPDHNVHDGAPIQGCPSS